MESLVFTEAKNRIIALAKKSSLRKLNAKAVAQYIRR